VIETRKQSVATQLRSLDDRLRAVRANSAAVEEAIYQMLQACPRARALGVLTGPPRGRRTRSRSCRV
jgi:hypothetical protein